MNIKVGLDVAQSFFFMVVIAVRLQYKEKVKVPAQEIFLGGGGEKRDHKENQKERKKKRAGNTKEKRDLKHLYTSSYINSGTTIILFLARKVLHLKPTRTRQQNREKNTSAPTEF